MKNLILLITFSLGIFCVQAQSHMNVHLTNGTVTSFLIVDVDSVTYGNPPVSLPTVTTNPVTSIADTTARSGGNIVNNGGGTIIDKGICWSKTNPPSIADSIAISTLAGNYFSLWMNDLEKDSIYFVRAFATNSSGTSYGQVNYFYATGGNYLGTMSGNLDIPLFSTDTTFTNIPTNTVIWQTSPTNMNISFEWSNIVGGSQGSIVPTVSGILFGTTLTITNQTYNFQGIADFTVDGTIEFDATLDNILNTSTITITNDATGTYTLNGVKQ